VADVRGFSLAPRRFFTRCGGLFLFVPELIRLHPEKLAEAAKLPGSKMIPCAHALRARGAPKRVGGAVGPHPPDRLTRVFDSDQPGAAITESRFGAF